VREFFRFVKRLELSSKKSPEEINLKLKSIKSNFIPVFYIVLCFFCFMIF